MMPAVSVVISTKTASTVVTAANDALGWLRTASSPTEGIEFYEERLDEIGLVLLDYFMPEMTGEFVFE